MRSTNTREVALIFRDYARKIHHKAKPQDPNFLRLSVMCSKVVLFTGFVGPVRGRLTCTLQIEGWYEQNFPSFIVLGQNGVIYDPEDKRTAVFKLEEKRVFAKRYPNAAPPSPDVLPWELVIYVGGTIGAVILLSAGIVYTIVKVYG